MRIATSTAYLITSRGLEQAKEAVTREQTALALGKRVSRWSDDAAAAVSAQRYRAQEDDLASFDRAVTDARGWLSSADGGLQAMSRLLDRAQSLAVQAVNGGLSDDSRRAIADELAALRSQLRDLASAKHLGRPLFGGFADEALSTAPDGTVTWTGDAGQVRRQVSPTTTLTVNVDGRTLLGFGSAQGSAFDRLAALENAVRTGATAAVQAAQPGLRDAHDLVLKGLAQVGATAGAVDTAATASAAAKEDLALRRSELEDVNVAEAVLKLTAAQAGYQAALGAAARANLPSLADFLR